jgi:hypothetical protein
MNFVNRVVIADNFPFSVSAQPSKPWAETFETEPSPMERKFFPPFSILNEHKN